MIRQTSAAEQVLAEPRADVIPIARGLGSHLRVHHEGDIEWFFCEGESMFEASTFGAVLERQALFGQHFDDCKKCDGSGFTKDDGTCGACKGSGGKPRRIKNPPRQNQMRVSTMVCVACKGGLLRLVKRRKAGVVRYVCNACDRRGYVELNPAFLRAADQGGEPSYTPDDGALMRFARVSRWIMGVRPGTARVLEAYYGHVGCNWGGTKWGRLFAVVPFTSGGHSMLSRVANPLALSDSKLLRNLCEQVGGNQAQSKQTNFPERIREATAEAHTLYSAAVGEWNGVVPSGGRA
jgi:hypothetical protein